MKFLVSDIIIMLFGILGSFGALLFFVLEYGKWKRRSIIISRQQKVLRTISFIFLVSIFDGITCLPIFRVLGNNKVYAITMLAILLLVFALLVVLFIDLTMMRSCKRRTDDINNPYK